MKKHTGINTEYYMNDRKDQNTYILCKSSRRRSCGVMEMYEEMYGY